MNNPLILVVEDENALRENITAIIAHYGFRVISAPSGEAGVRLAVESNPDIIICDIMLPGIDGFEVLAQIKQAQQSATHAFIFLTAKSTRSDTRAGMNMGADDYLTKPFTKEELLNSIKARLEKLVQIRQSQPEKDALIEASLGKITSLTKAERKVLDKIAEGFTTPQIAEKLFVSKKTIENHRVNISRKLDLSGPNSLINFALRLRAQKFTYSHGMDSMEPEFDKVWMGLWRVHMTLMPLFALVTWGWILKTRDTKEQLDNLDTKLEIKRYFYWMMWLGVYLFGVYWGGSFFTEQDASWHQVIIRDTSFTPSHVVVFYGSFPMYIVCGVASYLYAMTRLPLYSRGTSFPLVMAIAGPLMILPNVGLNEWGHAFWFMEELFSAPLHWGFVILGWAGLFSGGIAAQIITRYSNLTDVTWNGSSRDILNNRIVP